MNNKTIYATYTNNTDSDIKVCAFEFFNKNKEGILRQISGIGSDFFDRFFYDQPHVVNGFRMIIQKSELLSRNIFENPLMFVGKTPMAEYIEVPICVPLDLFSEKQFQSNILDVNIAFCLDSLGPDIEFTLPRNTKISLVFYLTHGLSRSRSNLSI